MNSFKEIITKYASKTTKPNDKRIMLEALNLLNDAPILSENEINIFKEIFMALKEDYTLSIIQDQDSLNFMVEICEQTIPIIENKHDVNALHNELIMSTNKNYTNLESAVLTFLCACEHIEENEVMIIHEIIKFIEKNWTLSPIERKIVDGKLIRNTQFIPAYQKRLVKRKETN